MPRTSYEQSKFGKAVDKKDLQVGDLVFFDTMGKSRVSHVGMYVGNNEFVHAKMKRLELKSQN
ncbi:NlpC/P60 family protein [Paraclostridium bifermentans]|nr:NlpC/P60 family protein [Paraclostridium bifermentans]